MFNVVDAVDRCGKQTVRSNGNAMFMCELNYTTLKLEREPDIGLDKVDLEFLRSKQG